MAKFSLPRLSSFKPALLSIWNTYDRSTDFKCKLIDAYLAYIVATAVIQIAYVIVLGSSFPFNSLLSGFLSCVGSFVLGVSLRMQIVNPTHDREFDFSPERAFADFIVGNLLLHFVALSFIG